MVDALATVSTKRDKTPGWLFFLRPRLPLFLVVLLLVITAGSIWYVQKTLSEIENALPIKLSNEERDIRILVHQMGQLVQYAEFARDSFSDRSYQSAINQTLLIEKQLADVRANHLFEDILGISAIHAQLNPAIYDIKNWLTVGVHNFDPDSVYTIQLVAERAIVAYEEADLLLRNVEESANQMLAIQASRIKDFRIILVMALMVLTFMTIGLIFLGFRLQRIVGALKDSEEKVRYRANFDLLTKLPNRSHFIDLLTDAVNRRQPKSEKTALMFIDLDHFKVINDTLGHDHGDDLIKQVAIRIQQSIRETDVVSRLGGDEFTVLLTGMADSFHASMVAEDILARLSRSFDVFGHEVYTAASIGITICPDDGYDANTLLKNADMAMYESKDQGRNTFRFFTPEMTERAQHILKLDQEMRNALKNNEIQVFYQPIFDLQNHQIVGVEALMRWQHPDRGLIGPTEFIEVIEDTGLIDAIGMWVLNRACKDVVCWSADDLMPDFYLAINISKRQFKGGFNDQQVKEILQDSGFPANRLMFDVTEPLLMDEDAKIKGVLAAFEKMGIRIAVDDFGTGFSALSYLRENPVHTLKIDQSFIRKLTEDFNGRQLIESIITMAHSLELTTIAEGVETAQQMEILKELNCKMAQGNYFCEPLSSLDLIGRFKTQS